MGGRKVSGSTRVRSVDVADYFAPSLGRLEGSDLPSLQSTVEGCFVFRECQYLLKERLTDPVLHLFAGLIGLELHVIWHHPDDFGRSGELPVLCPAARRRLESANELSTTCRGCLQEHWATAASAACDMCRFAGLCGVVNLCASFEIAGARPFMLALQAPTVGRDLRPAVKRRTSRRFLDHPSFRVASPDVSTDVRFERAEALLRLILHDLKETFHARLAEAELRQALHSMSDNSEWRKKLLRGIRPGCAAPTSVVLERHSQQIVCVMLDYIQHHYQHPMALRELAADLKMNANYLSDLFSKTMGVPFHRYLEEFRLAKAEELLSDPRARVCDVAYAVGYSNPNHFCSVFKIHEGISPSAWRDAYSSPAASRVFEPTTMRRTVPLCQARAPLR
jgi:AraC-like DNA-binding protein